MKTALDPAQKKPKKKVEAPTGQDDHAHDRAVMAELRNVHARPKTMLGNSYRGRK